MNTQMITAFLVKQSCCSCGVIFGIENYHNEELRKSHQGFYCPNGHSQHYTAKSAAEILQDELTREKARCDQAKMDAQYERRQRIAKQGQLTKVKNRIMNGVCPCCNRYFDNLKRHMEIKHKEPQK